MQMEKCSSIKKYLILLLTFMKIGLFTFGGGYAMIPLIQDEVCKKKKWITEQEIIDIIAISETTPGPIAVNAATFVGYRVSGILGAIFATIGLTIPSFIIIFVISFFYKDFIQIKFFDALFKGLKIGVILLLFSAFLKIKKALKINMIGIIIFALVLVISIVFSFINISFNYLSLILILLGIFTGLFITALSRKDDIK